jgi:hypothetical protein
MAGQLVALRHPTVAEAAEAFLARTMPGTTRRFYAQTMSRLVAADGGLPLSALDGPALGSLTTGVWGGCAPATWNRHVATLRSFTTFARRKGWLASDPAAVPERRSEPADRTKATAASSLARLFRREDAAIRGKCLWRSGGCCMKLPAAPKRCSRPTSATSTWRTSVCGWCAREATGTGCTSSRARLACSRG